MSFFEVAKLINIIGILIGFFLVLYRIYLGPSTADRVIALDLLAFLVIGFIVGFCINIDNAMFLNAAIVLALVAFLGTIAFAKYLETKHLETHENRVKYPRIMTDQDSESN